MEWLKWIDLRILNLLNASGEGVSQDNIAFDLLLVIGWFYSYDSISSMRYHQ